MIKEIQEIVRQASVLMMHPEHLDVTQKDGYENIVTSADIAVQEFLQDRLSKLLPGSGFICEEGDIADDAHEYVWIIDPIDGTANYARGTDQCAICVGLYSRDAMQQSVVYLPRRNEMYTAERGRGAQLNGCPIHVSDREFSDCIMCTALPVYYKEQAAWCACAIQDVFVQCNDIRRLGAAAPELCAIARGQFDMYFEYRLGAWDFAAASLIVSEAGGVLSDIEGNPLDPTKADGVLAANNRKNLDRIIETVNRFKP